MKKTIYLLIFIIFYSCEFEKNIDYDVYYPGDKIVVHGTINSKDGLRVFVKKTIPPDAFDSNDVLTNPVVWLRENDTDVVQLTPVTEYLFTLPDNYMLNQNVLYSIRASSSNLQEVFSSGQALSEVVPIDSLRYRPSVFQDKYVLDVFYTSSSLDLSYFLKLDLYHNGDIIKTIPNFESNFEFIDVQYPDHLGLQQSTYRVGYLSEIDSIQVKLYSLSPDYTKFIKSYEDFTNTFGDPFYEYTYPVYSNIENGYGLFASYSYDIKSIIN